MITSGISPNVQNLVKIRSFPSLLFFLAVLYRKNDRADFNARWLI